MSSAEVLSVLIDIRTDISKAVSGLNQVRDITEKTTQKMSAFKQAGAQAAGMLMRDMVQGATAAIGEIFNLTGKLDTLQNSFNKLTESAGATDITLESLRSGTENMVSDIDLLTSANQALMLGLPTEGLEDMFGAAIKLGNAMGIDAAFAVDSLTKGIGRQSRMILDNLGVVFDASEAYEWYAAQIGVSSSELDESQMKLGWQQFAMEQVKVKAAELGDVISDATKTQQQYNAKVENAKTATAGFLAPLAGLLPIFKGLLPMIGTLAGTLLPQLITKQALAAAGTKLMAVAQGILSGTITATSVAQGILNAVMSVNPIFLIITAVGLLVGALVYLYKTGFEPVVNIVNAVIDALRSLWDFIGGVGSAIADFFGGGDVNVNAGATQPSIYQTGYGGGGGDVNIAVDLSGSVIREESDIDTLASRIGQTIVEDANLGGATR